jgi:hypothetical protein
VLDRRLGRALGRQPGRQDELADEPEPGCLEQLLPVQHPAEVLRLVAVRLGALQDDERRAAPRDRDARDEQVAVGRVCEPAQRPAPVLVVLKRARRDDEVVAALQRRVVVVERIARQQLAAERDERR